MSKRKEYTTTDSFFGLPGTRCYKTVVYDSEGRKAEGRGPTKEESIENAYKNWREKYK